MVAAGLVGRSERSGKPYDRFRNRLMFPIHSPSGRLVGALVGARILLSDGTEGLTSVRLAHEKVLENWERARKIVSANIDFYRIRQEVEEQRQRWLANRRASDLLIPPGLALAEAEELGLAVVHALTVVVDRRADPVSAPLAPTARWQGMTPAAWLVAQARPTARAEPGLLVETLRLARVVSDLPPERWDEIVLEFWGSADPPLVRQVMDRWGLPGERG